jgi:hypothetical protein
MDRYKPFTRCNICSINPIYLSQYLGKKLLGKTKIAFMDLNNMTKMEFLAGDPAEPSW